MYKLALTARAKKQLKSFKKSHQQAIAEAIEDLKEEPLLGKPLSMRWIRRYSLYIGVYRLIYIINLGDKVVTILNFDHQGRVYN